MSERRDRAVKMVQAGIIKPTRACTNKEQYGNQNDARHAAKMMAKMTQRDVDTYHCPFCDCYHISKRRFGEEA
jgi:hypothetical protein